jgi:AbiV family abortive infection protein
MNHDLEKAELAILTNIDQLLKESNLLYRYKAYSRSSFLIIIAVEEVGRFLLIKEGNLNPTNHIKKFMKAIEWDVELLPSEVLVQTFVEPTIKGNNKIIEIYQKDYEKLYKTEIPLKEIVLVKPETLTTQEIRNLLKDSCLQVARIIVMLRPMFLYTDIYKEEGDVVGNFFSILSTQKDADIFQKFYRQIVEQFLEIYSLKMVKK